MDSKDYTNCVALRIHPLYAGNRVFKQENCTSHKSRLANGWLDEQSSELYVINWPPRSPDLIHIDYLWDVLK
ncbi:hypothetical protein TNCV_1563511 [Trichonephila clavipes]|nr:hypothetical protein TNCV_1563511 [Trichonephila clavipes]